MMHPIPTSPFIHISKYTACNTISNTGSYNGAQTCVPTLFLPYNRYASVEGCGSTPFSASRQIDRIASLHSGGTSKQATPENSSKISQVRIATRVVQYIDTRCNGVYIKYIRSLTNTSYQHTVDNSAR